MRINYKEYLTSRLVRGILDHGGCLLTVGALSVGIWRVVQRRVSRIFVLFASSTSNVTKRIPKKGEGPNSRCSPPSRWFYGCLRSVEFEVGHIWDREERPTTTIHLARGCFRGLHRSLRRIWRVVAWSAAYVALLWCIAGQSGRRSRRRAFTMIFCGRGCP